MEFLIGAAIVAWVLKAAIEDAAYAIRGKPSPRMAAALAAGRPYGVRDYASRLWADGWTAMARRRKRRVLWRDRSGARGYIGLRWDDAWQRAWKRHLAKLADREAAAARRAPVADPPVAPAAPVMPQPPTTPVAEPEAPRPSPPPVVVNVVQPPARSAPEPPQAPAPRPVVVTNINVHVEPPSNPAPRTDAGQGPVIDGTFTETTKTETTKEKPMSAPTAELVSLSDTIRWTAAISRAAADAVQTMENAIGDLRRQGVGEAALAKLGAIQETYAILVAQADNANAEFISHVSVAEAYAAQSNAGDKQHLLAD